MMHSPSERQQRTFAEGMQGSFIASDVHNAVTQVCQKRHGVRATNSSSFKGNRCQHIDKKCARTALNDMF